MPLVKNTITGNNYLVKINTDGDACSRTAIRSYDKQFGWNGFNSRTTFYLPFKYDPSTHTLWVFVNGEKAVVEQTATNNRQYEEINNKSVRFGDSLNGSDVIEFIVAGSYLSEDTVSEIGGGLEWILVSNNGNVTNNYGYMIDTLSSPITFTLPATAEEGDTFAVADAFGNFGTNNATLNRNGWNIVGLAQDYIFDRDGQAAQFVFDGIDNWVIVGEVGISHGGLKWVNVNTDQTPTKTFHGYMVDTTTTAISATLPANPKEGDIVAFEDGASNFTNNNCVILRNGNTIMGLAENLTLNETNQGIQLVYNGSGDWRIVYTTPLVANVTIP